MLTPMPMHSREQRIRDEFSTTGPMTIPAFARHCIESGIFTDEELVSFAFSTVQSKVRMALKAPDLIGLPFAGQTVARADEAEEDDEDKPGRTANVWAQRSYWGYEDYALNIREAIVQRDTLHFHAVDLADECRGRFGRAPLIVTPVRRDEKARGVAD